MRRIPAALGLELVAKPTGEATVELERQLDGRRPQALRLPIEVLEDRFAAQLDLVTALDLDLFGGDVVGDLRAQWSTVISHEREPRTSVDPVAIEPEGVLALAIELYKRLLRVDRLVHSLHDELRRGSDRDTPGRADTQSGRPFRFRPFQGCPCRSPKPALRSRKFSSSRRPCSVQIESGWNWTPHNGRSQCSTAIKTPSLVQAIPRSSGGSGCSTQS